TFRDRVIRDGRYKVYIDTLKKIHRIYDLEKDPYGTINLIEDLQLDQPLMEKFRSVLDGLPQEDPHPRYERLNKRIYDIPPEDLNSLSRRIHRSYQNMLWLATSQEYVDLQE
ncbi:MAG: hypothetical protein AMS26_13260, partial [Bacteroides sp. SM23_62]